MYTLSLDGAIRGHGNEIRFPSTASITSVRTETKLYVKCYSIVDENDLILKNYHKVSCAPLL